MLRDEKNLKDLEGNSIKDTSSMPAPYQAVGFGLGSYNKTEKLITALYMVTDIIDTNEPIRNKLRTLGTEIISDMHLAKESNAGNLLSFIHNKIAEIISFLDIASAVNIISEMNCNILRKEFSALDQSIFESTGNTQTLNKHIDLVEFFANTSISEYSEFKPKEGGKIFSTPTINHHSKRELNSKGHANIGLQKGSTLMRALNGVKISERLINTSSRSKTSLVFDELKKQRRDAIVNIIKTISGGATIKDIKDITQTNKEKFNVLLNLSEKTLQRELISMVKDNVLDKTGEKRWSRYFVK